MKGLTAVFFKYTVDHNPRGRSKIKKMSADIFFAKRMKSYFFNANNI